MYSSIAIANYFLNKSFETGSGITVMKLLKLVYIAHGWYKGFTGQDLINEAVEAWKYGPVIRSIYDEFKEFGNRPITRLGQESRPIKSSKSGFIKYEFITPIIDDNRIISFLDLIWDKYSKFDAIQLSNLTHQSNSPWDKSFNPDAINQIIPNEYIERYYKGKIDAR